MSVSQEGHHGSSTPRHPSLKRQRSPSHQENQVVPHETHANEEPEQKSPMSHLTASPLSSSPPPSKQKKVAEAGSPYTESENRRREMLFLHDNEAFTFDFGGEAEEAVASLLQENASASATQEEESRKAKDQEEDAAQVRSRLQATKGKDPMEPERVSECQQDALDMAMTAYFNICQTSLHPSASPVPPASLRHPSLSASAQIKLQKRWKRQMQEQRQRILSLDEALQCYQDGIRSYEAGLWRERKKQRLEKQQQQKKKGGLVK